MEWKRGERNKREKLKRKKTYEYGDGVMPHGGWEAPRWVVQSCHLKCDTLKIRPIELEYSDSLNTHTKFLFYNQFQCVNTWGKTLYL